MKPLLMSLVVLAFLCTISVGTVTTRPASLTLTGQLSDGIEASDELAVFSLPADERLSRFRDHSDVRLGGDVTLDLEPRIPQPVEHMLDELIRDKPLAQFPSGVPGEPRADPQERVQMPLRRIQLPKLGAGRRQHEAQHVKAGHVDPLGCVQGLFVLGFR